MTMFQKFTVTEQTHKVAATRLIARYVADPDFFGGNLFRIEKRVNAAGDALLTAAWQLIKDGRPYDGPIGDYIGAEILPAIPHEMIARVRKSRAGDQGRDHSLTDQIWPGQGAVMVAAVSHLSGQFPDEPSGKRTCGGRAIINHYASGVSYIGGVNFRNVRGYMAESGLYMSPCPHCIHEMTLEKIEQLETAANYYRDFDLIGYAAVSPEEAKRIKERVKKRNQRRGENDPALNVVKVGSIDGRIILIHDLPDLERESFPRDRAELYELIESWIRRSADEGRNWRGLSSWGHIKDAAGDDEEEQESGRGGDEEETAEQKDNLICQIMVSDRADFYQFVEAYLELEKPITSKGLRIPDLDLSHLLASLSDYGLDYAVTKGNVPLKTLDKKVRYVKRDKRPDQGPDEPPGPAQNSLLGGQK